MALGIRRQQPPRFGDTRLLAHASEHIGQNLPLGNMVMHVVDCHERHVHLARQFGQRGQAVFAPRAVKPGGGEIGPVRCMRRKRGKIGTEGLGQIVRRHDDENLAFAFGEDVGQRQMALAFFGAAVAARQQAAKPFVGQAVHRIRDRLEAVARHQPRADQQTQILLLRHGVGAHDTRQRVAVRDSDGGQPQFAGALDQFFRVACPAQKGEVRRHRQLRVAHANTPCTYQRGFASPSAISSR